jgi:hypothetical protein
MAAMSSSTIETIIGASDVPRNSNMQRLWTQSNILILFEYFQKRNHLILIWSSQTRRAQTSVSQVLFNINGKLAYPGRHFSMIKFELREIKSSKTSFHNVQLG